MKIEFEVGALSLGWKRILVGVKKGSVDQQGIRNKDKIELVEYGDQNTPPRPFMEESTEIIQKEGVPFWDVNDPQEIGEDAVKIVQNHMNKGNFTPLAAYTIKQRRVRGNKSDQPTVDTGELRDSITYEIQR